MSGSGGVGGVCEAEEVARVRTKREGVIVAAEDVEDEDVIRRGKRIGVEGQLSLSLGRTKECVGDCGVEKADWNSSNDDEGVWKTVRPEATVPPNSDRSDERDLALVLLVTGSAMVGWIAVLV